MKQKHLLKSLLIGCGLFGSLYANAQTTYFTYNHDETKLNQITVQEIGAGSLTPEYYYKALHRSYLKSARSRNKIQYRTLAETAAYQQINDADSVETSMKKRSETEALNMADRQIDLAWLTEGSKINSKLESFETNINRIVRAGGSFSDKERWVEYLNIYKNSIHVTQKAYMPNSQRKKEYLAIYADLCQKNDMLVLYLAHLCKMAQTDQLLSATYTKPDHRKAIATAAHNRWRSSSWLMK